MLPKLKVSIFLLKRLERVKLQCSGCLYGIVYGEGTLLLLSFNIEPTIGKRSYEQIEHNFPAEIDLCGLVKFGDCADGLLSEVLSSVDITDNPIVLQCQLGTLVGLRASFFVHGKLEEVPYEVMEAPQLYNDFCFARLKCGLNIKTSWTKEDLMQEMHVLRKNVADGGLVFNIQNTKVYVNCSGPQSKNISNESLIEHLLQALPNLIPNDIQRDSNSMVRVSQQSIALGCGYDVINIDVFRCRTRDPVARDAPPHPSLNICIKNEEQVTMNLICKRNGNSCTDNLPYLSPGHIFDEPTNAGLIMIFRFGLL
ncbi:probable Ufm1-specific protease 2 isoform X2 [Scaptodrosophila lebanonensis]|uniref:Probable Ufm1-specific protease 2 isoform X2 n=1 Tax=Drosophila lebanonensis TaxID=7225 RepID=A0A6J2TXZ9_DROLE|nr:probable Ufm1-specific protease 2 isoform X2 [Scaptodrosophila lebanonensis]